MENTVWLLKGTMSTFGLKSRGDMDLSVREAVGKGWGGE
jgi:hypothetical protein